MVSVLLREDGMLKRRKSKVVPLEKCPVSVCMNLIGGAWTPNIFFYLKEGPRRFSELRDDIGGVSAKVLSQRLRRLEDDGLVHRQVVPTSPPTVEYSLTELGFELKPAIEAIVRVGEKLKRRRLE
jgi:DNA-binding HxlR family transcriptional regulator